MQLLQQYDGIGPTTEGRGNICDLLRMGVVEE